MEKIVPKKEWSAAIRINHWAMAISIFALIVTGFYIAYPFTIYTGETTDKNLMGYMRFFHIIFGFILMLVFIWRVYLAFFSRFHADWKDFFAFFDVDSLIHQIKFYLLIEKEGPPHGKYVYGPMQSLAYLGLMGMIFFIVLTGLILTGACYHAGLSAFMYKLVRPFEYLLGGLAMVRYLHHILTWGFILFIIVHVYMAFWYDVILRQGTISSMASGYLFKKGEKH